MYIYIYSSDQVSAMHLPLPRDFLSSPPPPTPIPNNFGKKEIKLK